MAHRHLLLFGILAALSIFILTYPQNNDLEVAEKVSREVREDKKTRMDLAMEQEIERTRDPALGYVPKHRLLKAKDYADQMRQRLSRARAIQGIEWIERGPTNVGGRTRAIMIDPNNSNTIWSAGVAGGLWVSNDINNEQPTWESVDEFFDNMAITSLAYDPSNTSIMYFGTGEGYFNTDAVEGNGIWKSTDGGSTWNVLGSTVTDNRTACTGSGDCDFQFVQKIVVTSTGVVLAATRSIFSNRGGIMRSTDGGTTWTKVLTGLTDPNPCSTVYLQWASDIEIASNGDIYAAFGIARNNSIWKSTDNGATWGASPVYTAACDEERIELALAPSNSDVIYALIQEDNNTIKKIMRSSNGGSSWTDLTLPDWNDQSCSTTSTDFTRGQAWYDLIAAVDPNDEDVIYIGGVDILRSEDGGSNWTQLTSWNGLGNSTCSYPEVHADQHAMIYQSGSSDIMYFGNDGGVYRTDNASATQPTFKRKEFNFNTTQFYSVAMDPTAGSSYFIGGTQDNGTNKLVENGLGPAVEPVGGDGGFAHIDQTDNQFQLAATTRTNIRRSLDGGNTFSSIRSDNTGFFINPSEFADSDDVFYCSYNAGEYLRSSNVKTSASFNSVSVTEFGTGRVTAITASPNTSQRVFFGLDNGDLFMIDDAGNAMPVTVTDLTDMNFPNGTISSIAVEDGDDEHILITFSNYGVTSVWETTGPGINWTEVEGNLPDMPIRWVIFSPISNDEAMIATELGVWSTDDLDGSSTEWEPSNSGLANVRVDMLQIRSSDNLVIAATHGRGMYTSDIFTTATADFGTDREVIYAERSVEFTDISYQATSWSWDFGDGGVSTQQNPTHKYNFPGTYTVSLTINGGADTETKSSLIHVLPNLGTPFANADGGNFESNQSYFASESLKGGINLWELGTPSGTVTTLNSGTNGWKTDLDANIQEADYACALYSPNYNFTEAGTYTLSFQKSMSVAFANGPMAVQVQYSTDRGNNWTTLGSDNDLNGTSWYERGPSSTFTVDTEIFHNRVGFVNIYTNQFTDYDISFLAGNSSVAFRFVLAVSTGFSSTGYNRDGFMIDDFQISGPTNSALTNITDPLAVTAIQCDGSSGYVELSEVVVPETFTATLWVNPANTNDGQSFLAKHDNSGNDIFGIGFYNGGYEARIRGETFSAGTKETGLQHIAVSVDKTGGSTSEVTIYRNGEQLGQQTLNDVIGDASGLSWVAGMEWDGVSTSDFLNGSIEEAILWDGVLTQTDIRERMHITRSGLESDLLAYWQFNEGSGTTPLETLTSNSGNLVGNSSYITSDYPVGPGISEELTISVDDNYSFSSTGVDISLSGVSGSFDLMVSRINADPGGTQPEQVNSFNELIKSPYYIIEQFGSETFTSAGLTYVLGSGVIAETDPVEIKLFKRGSYESGTWTEEATATNVNTGTGQVDFSGITSFSQTVIGTSPGPLPVDLIEFTASYKPLHESVSLNWKTASEINNDYFEIQRSSDLETWEIVSIVKGNGTTQSLSTYNFTDEYLPPDDVLYYRLKQVDYDGEYEFSDIRSISIPIRTDLHIYPNPLNERSVLSIRTQENQEFQLKLFDSSGKIIWGKNINVDKAETHDISLGELEQFPHGLYILSVTGKYYSESIRLIH